MKILASERETPGTTDEQFVENGLISFDLIPLVPYPGFERLFALPGGNPGSA